MRKVERIDTFCTELAKIWKENCPDSDARYAERFPLPYC